MPRLRQPRPPLPRFAVAWFPSFPGLDRVEAFRRAHDPMAKNIPAHLTLVFPFATNLKRLQVETHVRRVASKWPPVPVTFRAVRMHANEFLFLMASRGAASITALHDRLYTRSLRQPADVLRELDLLAVEPDGKIESLCKIALHTS